MLAVFGLQKGLHSINLIECFQHMVDKADEFRKETKKYKIKTANKR